MDRREAITESNLGPVVSLLTWITAAAVIIAVGIKFTVSSIRPGKRNREDIALFLATAFSIGFTIALSLAVPNGIGRHRDTLSTHELEVLQKALYSADIFLVLVSICVQASVLIFLHEITPERAHQIWIYGIAAFLTLFFVPSFLVAINPCRSPNVWEVMGGHCIDQLSFWQTFAGVNILIEIALVLLPILMVYPLMMEGRRKAIVVSGFAARLLVIGAFTAQIYEAHLLKSHTLDRTFHVWKYLLTMVFVQGFSIITVCIPYIRNMLLGMESGMIQTGHFRLPSRHGYDIELRLPTISSGETSTGLSSNSGVTAEDLANSQGRMDSRPEGTISLSARALLKPP
ncbi:hypothetical protein F4780DRAFT_773572 [Xylariomycetidae sp. FL0641]|nr:hypothetical protein F4780DRAFT_773572 [Xylariomycetidae sp. FL0641]